MKLKEVVESWFDKWESGDLAALPIAENFRHTSPYGTINGKQQYMDLVAANKDKFLGHRFQIHDSIFGERRACVRYTAIQGDFRLEVSEWHFIKGELIEEIIAYYNIDEERIKIEEN